MSRAPWFRATILALSLSFLSPLAQLWDALVALVLDAQTENATEAPPPDRSTDGSDRSAALDPLG